MSHDGFSSNAVERAQKHPEPSKSTAAAKFPSGARVATHLPTTPPSRKRAPSLAHRTAQKEGVFQKGDTRKWRPTVPAFGRFFVHVPGQNCLRHQVVALGICPTKWDAERELLQYVKLNEFDSGRLFIEKAARATTFRKQALRWIAGLSTRRRPRVKPATIRTRQNYLDKWLLPILGDLPLAEINHDSLQGLVQKMTVAGLPPESIVECRAIARSITASLVNYIGEPIYPHRWSFIGYNEVHEIRSEPDGLQKLFSEFNQRYFAGKLPTVPVNWSPDELRRGRFGILEEAPITSQKVILIAAGLRRCWRVAAMTLLHEMVHLYLDPIGGHGPEFQCEMLRLATEGAFEGLW